MSVWSHSPETAEPEATGAPGGLAGDPSQRMLMAAVVQEINRSRPPQMVATPLQATTRRRSDAGCPCLQPGATSWPQDQRWSTGPAILQRNKTSTSGWSGWCRQQQRRAMSCALAALKLSLSCVRAYLRACIPPAHKADRLDTGIGVAGTSYGILAQCSLICSWY